MSAVSGHPASLSSCDGTPQAAAPLRTPIWLPRQGRQAPSFWGCCLSCAVTPPRFDPRQPFWSVVRPHPAAPLQSQWGARAAAGPSRLSRDSEGKVRDRQRSARVYSCPVRTPSRGNKAAPCALRECRTAGGLGDRPVGWPAGALPSCGRSWRTGLRPCLGLARWAPSLTPGTPVCPGGASGPSLGARGPLLGQGSPRPLRHGARAPGTAVERGLFCLFVGIRLREVKSCRGPPSRMEPGGVRAPPPGEPPPSRPSPAPPVQVTFAPSSRL